MREETTNFISFIDLTSNQSLVSRQAQEAILFKHQLTTRNPQIKKEDKTKAMKGYLKKKTEFRIQKFFVDRLNYDVRERIASFLPNDQKHLLIAWSRRNRNQPQTQSQHQPSQPQPQTQPPQPQPHQTQTPTQPKLRRSPRLAEKQEDECLALFTKLTINTLPKPPAQTKAKKTRKAKSLNSLNET